MYVMNLIKYIMNIYLERSFFSLGVCVSNYDKKMLSFDNHRGDTRHYRAECFNNELSELQIVFVSELRRLYLTSSKMVSNQNILEIMNHVQYVHK